MTQVAAWLTPHHQVSCDSHLILLSRQKEAPIVPQQLGVRLGEAATVALRL